MKALARALVMVFVLVGLAQAETATDLVGKARAEAEKGGFEQAEKLVTQALSLGELKGSYLADGIYLRARLRDRLGKLEDAISDYSQVLAMAPEDFNSYINRGGCYLGLQKLDLALADYNQAASLKPDHPYAYNNRSVVLEKLGRVHEALADMEKAVRLAPDKEAYRRRLEALRQMLKAMGGR